MQFSFSLVFVKNNFIFMNLSHLYMHKNCVLEMRNLVNIVLKMNLLYINDYVNQNIVKVFRQSHLK